MLCLLLPTFDWQDGAGLRIISRFCCMDSDWNGKVLSASPGGEG